MKQAHRALSPAGFLAQSSDHSETEQQIIYSDNPARRLARGITVRTHLMAHRLTMSHRRPTQRHGVIPDHRSRLLAPVEHAPLPVPSTALQLCGNAGR